MPSTSSAFIDFTEAAYDLGASHERWLPQLIRAGAPFLDRGVGILAITCVRPPEPGPLVIDQLHVASGPDDFVERVEAFLRDVGTEILWPISRPGMPKTLSEVTRDHAPATFSTIMRYFDFAKDGLGMSAFDPDRRGVFLITALPKKTSLTLRRRERWQMLAAHFGAGYRLRRGIRQLESQPCDDSLLPFGAEAIIDTTGFRITEATGRAKTKTALAALREAVVRVDRSRGRLRKDDPEEALKLWRALVRGRWSTVDWFDSDGRRFMLGIPNTPGVEDPRGLTERETQVVEYAVTGLSNKMIGYHLGLSKARVSALMASATRKLGAHTRVELIKKIQDFGPLS